MTIRQVRRIESLPEIPRTLEDGRLLRYVQDENRALREWYREYQEGMNRALNLPTFRVHRNGSNQTAIADITTTKIAFNSVANSATAEGYDDFAYFDLTTNYRYTPKIPGVYLFSLNLRMVAMVADKSLVVQIQKNGNGGIMVASSRQITPTTTSPLLTAVGMCRLNGSTDYVEAWVYQDSGAPQDINGAATITFFAGGKVADY
jgi:hypothetical protein